MPFQPPTPPMDHTYFSQEPTLPANSNGQVELHGSPYTPPEDRGVIFHHGPLTENHPQTYPHPPSLGYPSGQEAWRQQASLSQFAHHFHNYPPLTQQNAIYVGEDHHMRERNPATRGKIVKQPKEVKPVQKSRKKRAQKGGTEPEILPPNFKPLSVLAESYPNFDNGATEAHVRRGKAVREHENVTRGRAKRPLNCFILYRKHFNGVTKEELKKAARATPGEKPKDGEPLIRSINPRVSEYVARSWRNETKAVRARFDALALEDASEHLLADPTYKYSPKPKKRKGGKARSGGKGRANRRKNNRPDSDDEDDTYFSDPDMESIASPHHTPRSIYSDLGKSPLPAAIGQEWVAVEQASSPYLDPGYHHYQQQAPSFHFQQAGQELQACLQQPHGLYQPLNQREYPPMTVDPRIYQDAEAEGPSLGLPSSTQFTPGYADGGNIEMSVGQLGMPDDDAEFNAMINCSS